MVIPLTLYFRDLLPKQKISIFVGLLACLGIFNLLSYSFLNFSKKAVKGWIISLQLLVDLAVLISLMSLMNRYHVLLLPISFLHLALGCLVLDKRQILIFVLGVNYLLALYQFFLSSQPSLNYWSLEKLEWLVVHLTTVLFSFIFYQFGSFIRQQNQEVNRVNHLKYQQDRLKALGSLSAGMVHELANPLQNIRLSIEAQHFSFPNPETESCMNSLEKCEAILRQMNQSQLDFKDSEFSQFDFGSFLKVIVNKWSSHSELLVAVLCADEIIVKMPKMNFAQILINLLDNSLEARSSEVELRVVAKGSWLTILICDNGDGFNQHVLDRLGQPFNSNKQNGVGLGFYSVHLFCQLLNGRWKVQSHPGVKGSIISLELPVVIS